MQWRPGVLVAAGLAVTALQLGALAAPTQAADAPAHSVTVTGNGVATWPAYDTGTDRYAVHTDDTTNGTLTVTAGTTDPDGTITVNGIPATNGQPLTLADLVPGDEVAVAIADSGGTTHQSWIYLPTGFPTITSHGSGSPGLVFLGLGSFLAKSSYETVVDDQGVPVYVREVEKAHDFKVSGTDPSHYTVAHLLPGSTNVDAGYQIDELGPDFERLRSFTLAPIDGIRTDDTDFHDVQLASHGRVVLVGYHQDQRSGGKTWLDAVIQIRKLSGRVLFNWTSKGHVKPSEGYVFGARGQDYAHINSVQLLGNGDLIASFRNLGQVMRIATAPHDGFASGDVIWRMGGHRNEFTFPDDPFGGFCAQHDARILPNGHLLLFDNGSGQDPPGSPISPQTADMCPDPAHPGGGRIARRQSRVVEYTLDEAARSATLYRQFVPTGRYAAFAGNAQRLEDGNTLVGWSAAQEASIDGPAPIASEVTANGDEVWSITSAGWFSYRAYRYAVPDAQVPEITVTGLEDGGYYQPGTVVTVDYSCSDRGGSNLTACSGDLPSGSSFTVDQSGDFTVTASDGAGNTVTRTLHYSTVVVDPVQGKAHVDAARATSGPWDNRVDVSAGKAGVTRTAWVRVTNAFDERGRLPVSAPSGTQRFGVRYFHAGTDVTQRLTRGLRTPRLAPGQHWLVRVEITRREAARAGDRFVAEVRAGGGWIIADLARVVMKAR